MNYILILVGAFVIGASVWIANQFGIKGTGDVRSENTDLPPFNKVVFKGAGDLILEQSSGVYSLEASMDSNLFKYFETDVQGDTLFIRFRKFPYSFEAIRLVLSAPEFQSLITEKVGNVEGFDLTSSSDFELQLKGLGKVALSLKAPRISVVNSGAGKIGLRGKFDEMNCRMSGAGEFDFEGSTASSELLLSGAGRIKADFREPLESLRGKISGAGKLAVSGSGERADYSLSGTGKILARDFSVKRAEVSLSGAGSLELFAGDEIRGKLSGAGSIQAYGGSEVNVKVSGAGRIYTHA